MCPTQLSQIPGSWKQPQLLSKPILALFAGSATLYLCLLTPSPRGNQAILRAQITIRPKSDCTWSSKTAQRMIMQPFQRRGGGHFAAHPRQGDICTPISRRIMKIERSGAVKECDKCSPAACNGAAGDSLNSEYRILRFLPRDGLKTALVLGRMR